MKTNLKQKVIWNTAGSVFYSFCQWAMTIVIVFMTTGYEDAGMLGLAMTVTNTFTTLSSFGMRSFQISDLAGKFKNEDYLFSRLLTAACAFLLCAGYTVIIGCPVGEGICILTYMLLRLTESVEDVLQAILQIHDRYDVIGISYILRGTAQLLIFIGGYLATRNMTAVFLIMFFGSLTVMLLYDIPKLKVIARIGKPVWSPRIPSLLRECSGLVVYYFLISFMPTMIRVMIRQHMGTDVLGIYSTVSSPTAVIQLLSSVVFSPFIPVFAMMIQHGERKKLLNYVRYIMCIILCTFFVVTAAGQWLGPFALRILYNEKVASYSDMLVPLLWATLLSAYIWFFAGILIAARRTKPLIWGAICAVVINYLLGRIWIPRMGCNGGSYAQSVSGLLLMLFFLGCVLTMIHQMGKKEQNHETNI